MGNLNEEEKLKFKVEFANVEKELEKFYKMEEGEKEEEKEEEKKEDVVSYESIESDPEYIAYMKKLEELEKERSNYDNLSDEDKLKLKLEYGEVEKEIRLMKEHYAKQDIEKLKEKLELLKKEYKELALKE